MRLIAVDWSGALVGAEKKIWLAECVDGEVTRLECGRSREAIAGHLIDLADKEPEIVVGFDFGFSAPAWYLASLGVASAPELWALACERGEDWLTRPPFWGGGRGPRPDLPEHYRRSDMLLPRVGGVAIKSVFQAGGSGSVGTGSVRGWPLLHRLRQAGFAVWPFDQASLPLVVEIYPRLLTGPVNKSSARARRAHLTSLGRKPSLVEAGSSCDDAFDALVSVLVMSRTPGAFATLPPVHALDAELEGLIWHPAWETVVAGSVTSASQENLISL